MTPADRTAYKLKWHKFQQRYEDIYTGIFKAALQKQVHQYMQRQSVMDISPEPIHKALTSLYKTVGPLWAAYTGIHKVQRELKALMPMGFSERIVELMRQYYGIDLVNDAELMTRTTRELIAQVLSDAALSGASFDMIVRTLTTHPEFSDMRARRIARTETVTAANGAAIVNAKESGLLMKKEWIAIEDKRTRHSHREVDGTIIALDEAYNVNGSLMMQPGVRTLVNGLPTPAGEVVNCRCTQGFIAQRDRAGRLIRV